MAARAARPEDAGAIAELLIAGFETYAAWAGGWTPSEELRAAQRDAWPRSLAEPDRWTLVAEVAEPVGRGSGALVAVVSFGPARAAPGSDVRLPGVAHIGAVFVAREWWGRGIARALLGAATAEIASRGYERARLIVPRDHARARDLYARNGWREVGRWDDERLGLPLLELRLDLDPR